MKNVVVVPLRKLRESGPCQERVAWVHHEEAPCQPELPPGAGLKFVSLFLKDLMNISESIENYEREAARELLVG